MATEPPQGALAKQQFEEKVRKTFDDADKDKSGFVDFTELKELLANMSREAGVPPPGDGEAADTLKALDLNGDGKISYEEFLLFAKKLLS